MMNVQISERARVWTVITLCLLGYFMPSCSASYVNEWLLEVPGGPNMAKDVGDQYGFQLVKQFSDGFPNIYVFRKKHWPARRKRGVDGNVTKSLTTDRRIRWVEQQSAKVRTKRDFIHREAGEVDVSGTSNVLLHQDLLEAGSSAGTGRLPANKQSHAQSDTSLFNDPMWSHQWYMLDELVPSGRAMRSMIPSDPKISSLNVFPAWQSGYTGQDIVVTILDDGVETNHTDLISNYDPDASTDINGNDRDPSPRYDNPEDTHHGTRCAGEVAMQANNNICGVGIAYNARIGGIRMLDGIVTDRVEGEAFSFNNNYIHIYSSSWGPSDDGKTVEGPGLMASRAFEKGVTEGRQGKGVLYIWASGNGGINGDSCAYDGYASNIFTLSVGSTTERGHFPIYGEICASTMAVTYSSGSLKEGKIISTDILNSCTTEHTGTSASAPLAAGMIALALEANPSLTWRDMKHIVAWSADPFPLLNNPGWSVNGAGLLVSPAFGFGLMDANKLVKAAKVWQTAPPKVKCVVRKAGVEDLAFTHNRPLRVQVRTQACHESGNEINYLEHVETVLSLSHPKRGAVRIFLESPMGTRTLIAPRRDADVAPDGLNGWSFVSVHNWGENPRGMWTVIMESHANQSIGSLHSLRLIFHGTKQEPASTRILRDWRIKQGAAFHPDLNQPVAPPVVALIFPTSTQDSAAKPANLTAAPGSSHTFIDWLKSWG
ncbi:neuroendocrine convertase 1-like [Paramacrobiotus metropolitanus]|uniref:neuroendocrine convertase 1-like n=1 Tax=Paramacrobiotus metropolitanus TaxID=2943436 RepID=UPI002445E6C2|nr:neuroendocrine convertase 1-like [Paramacrobiotus metropolitanus]